MRSLIERIKGEHLEEGRQDSWRVLTTIEYLLRVPGDRSKKKTIDDYLSALHGDYNDRSFLKLIKYLVKKGLVVSTPGAKVPYGLTSLGRDYADMSLGMYKKKIADLR